MINYRIDNANERQPQVLRVNSTHSRFYFDQTEKTAEGMEEGETYTYWEAKFIETESTESDPLKLIQKAAIDQITAYDISSAVNEFSYGGFPMWLDKDTRNGLMMRFTAEESVGKTETTLWYAGVSFTIGITDGIAMLKALEVYASACYDNTELHKSQVLAMTDPEDVIAFDITAGYPEKLSF
ncbi:MAG: DUF4376 domain-containing protein [Bacilli bacterium]|nr:DUF4376 domain-containing protein [Bacilli bacterium]